MQKLARGRHADGLRVRRALPTIKASRTLRTGWAGTQKRAGITRKMRPYDLRHAFATEAIAAGADYGTVAKLMGHSPAQMVLQFYQHVMTEQK
ncbi:MAG: tyrosine-type recombinase/integrase [Desulfovibrionaceae bacterium]|nr:tyrosine-type recombinase/integrase [Desulfovibrionaceae bacterium]